MATSDLTAERLREILHYNPNTGIFTWTGVLKRTEAGVVAGTDEGKGYRRVKISGRLYLAHRLAWFYVFKVWPTKDIDHINRVRDDNRITNLREATEAENAQNVGLSKNSTSGYNGVSKMRNKWGAQIRVNKKLIYLGTYETPETAYAAYLEAKAVHHTFHPLMT